MMNEEFLEKREATQFRAGAEQVEKARKAGKASGAARRRKGDARRFLKMALAMKPEMTAALRRNLESMGANVNSEEFTTERLIMVALTQKAMKGDTRAIQLYLEMVEEDPKLLVEQNRLAMEMENASHVPGFSSLDEAVDSMMAGDVE